MGNTPSYHISFRILSSFFKKYNSKFDIADICGVLLRFAEIPTFCESVLLAKVGVSLQLSVVKMGTN